MITSDQLKDILSRREKLRQCLDIKRMKAEYEEGLLRTQAPDFWDEADRAGEQMKKMDEIKKLLEGFAKVNLSVEALLLALDFYKDGTVAMSEEEVDENYAIALSSVEEMELRNMLRQKEDSMDCVLRINSGAGGTEAQDWAGMLMRMYMRWAEKGGYSVTVSDLQEGDVAGIKSVTMKIEGGEHVYGFLKSESGVHRLVRVSPYNAQGKRMTSFASVFATPIVDDSIEVYVDPAKISWDTFRSPGPGGQKTNKVETGVRIRYMYTDPDTGQEEEILIANTESRNQHQNRENAMRLLKSQLYDRAMKKRLEARARMEAGKKKIEWGSQIRSYVLDDRRVTDHRTHYQTADVDGVLDGGIYGFIRAYLMEFAGGTE